MINSLSQPGDDRHIPRYHVALSFAGSEREYVERVAINLRDNGVRVFYDEFESGYLWGEDLYTYLDDIYQKQSDLVVMFVSKSYAERRWTIHEREAAQARSLGESRSYILPVRFDDTEVPGLRETVGYRDATKETPEELAQAIVSKLRSLGFRDETDINQNFAPILDSESDQDNAIALPITVPDLETASLNGGAHTRLYRLDGGLVFCTKDGTLFGISKLDNSVVWSISNVFRDSLRVCGNRLLVTIKQREFYDNRRPITPKEKLVLLEWDSSGLESIWTFAPPEPCKDTALAKGAIYLLGWRTMARYEDVSPSPIWSAEVSSTTGSPEFVYPCGEITILTRRGLELVAVDENGRAMWQRSYRSRVSGSWGDACTTDHSIYVILSREWSGTVELLAVNTRNGQRNWTHRLERGRGLDSMRRYKILAIGNKVLIYGVGIQPTALNGETGEQIWKWDHMSGLTKLDGVDPYVCSFSKTGELLVLDTRNGQVVYSQPLSSGADGARACLYDGEVVLYEAEGRLSTCPFL